MMVTKKFRMCELTLSGTVTFKAILLFGFAFVLWHECTGMNHCTGHKNFSVPQGQDITLTCNISAGSRMFWWLYLDERKMVGYCTLNKNQCEITDSTANYTLTSSGLLISELTIPGNIRLPKLDVGCSGPCDRMVCKEEQNCSIRVVYPPPSAPVISGVTNYTEGDFLQLTCTVTGGNPPVTSVAFSCGTQSDGKVTTSSSSGQPGMVSTITISSLTDKDHGSTCLCSATWKDKPSLYATTSSVTIAVLGRSGQSGTQDTTSVAATTVDGQRSSTDSNDNKDDDDGNSDDGDEANLAAIVGGATGGAAVVIIVALVIVIVIVWKRRCDPLCAET